MRLYLFSKVISLPVLAIVLALTSGCEGNNPPKAISLDQIPAELEKAFAAAKGETKELSNLAITSVQSKDLPKAALTLNALAGRPDVSMNQARTTSSAFTTVNAALREAEAKGDQKAAEALQIQRVNK